MTGSTSARFTVTSDFMRITSIGARSAERNAPYEYPQIAVDGDDEMTPEEMMKSLSDESGKDVAVVWVRRFNNFKVFLHDEITADTSLGDNGLVFGGDDIAEGLEAAGTMAKLGLMK